MGFRAVRFVLFLKENRQRIDLAVPAAVAVVPRGGDTPPHFKMQMSGITVVAQRLFDEESDALTFANALTGRHRERGQVCIHRCVGPDRRVVSDPDDMADGATFQMGLENFAIRDRDDFLRDVVRQVTGIHVDGQINSIVTISSETAKQPRPMAIQIEVGDRSGSRRQTGERMTENFLAVLQDAKRCQHRHGGHVAHSEIEELIGRVVAENQRGPGGTVIPRHTVE